MRLISVAIHCNHISQRKTTTEARGLILSKETETCPQLVLWDYVKAEREDRGSYTKNKSQERD